jgi:TPR repeat protein
MTNTDPETMQQTFNRGVGEYDAGKFEDAFKTFSSIDEVDLAAMRNVALMLRKGQGTAKDPKAAQEMYERAAVGGLPTAAADLGEMLLNGEAAAPDAKAALPWLQLAAAAHHPIAEYELGKMFEDGNGVPRDFAEARLLYTEAAQSGMKEAAARLAALPPAPAKPGQTP